MDSDLPPIRLNPPPQHPQIKKTSQSDCQFTWSLQGQRGGNIDFFVQQTLFFVLQRANEQKIHRKTDVEIEEYMTDV